MRKTIRYVRLSLMITVAILAAAIVSTLTVDVGSLLLSPAQRYASDYLKRRVAIGSMRLHVFTGHFLMEDFSISGLNEGDRPFFTAKRLSIALDWSTLLTQPSTITVRSVELTDWEMLVEKWSSQHSFPKFTRDRQEPEPERGPSRVKMKYLRAWRGQFAFEDHQMPWSVVAPNIDLNITDFPTYHGEAMFHGGTVAIQQVPADVGEHEDEVPPRRQPRAPDAARLRHRRLAELRRRRRRLQPVPGDALRREVSRQLPADARDFLQEGELGALRRWGFHRDVSSLQGRARPDRHVRQRGRRGLRLPLSAAVRIASLDAEGVRGHRGRIEAVWRRRTLCVFDQASGNAGRRDGAIRCVVHGRRSRRSDGFLRSARAALRRTRLGRERARVAQRTVSRESGERPRNDNGTTRRAADDGRSAAGVGRHVAARMGSVRAAAAAAPPPDLG